MRNIGLMVGLNLLFLSISIILLSMGHFLLIFVLWLPVYGIITALRRRPRRDDKQARSD